MDIKGFYPTIITEKLLESKEFYVRYLGFKVVFENDWYLHITTENGSRLAFLQPNHPLQPAHFHQAYDGKGIIYNFEVGDVAAVYLMLKNSNVNILSEIRAEEWGQKHFIIEDPNGMKIDIFQETAPTEEYRS